MTHGHGFEGPILVDTGTPDQFSNLPMPGSFSVAVAERQQQATLWLQFRL